MVKFLFFFCLSFSLFAQTEIPPLTPNVVDQANVLNSEEIQTINQKISEVRVKSDVWAAVYILKKLNNETIEELSERAFRTWKLGQKGKDNGILLVLAMEDRKSRFEVGYGLEGVFTDSETRYVLDHVLAPYMRHGKIEQAIEKSLEALVVIHSGEPTSALPHEKNDFERLLIRNSVINYVFFLFIVWFSSLGKKLIGKILFFRLQKKYPAKAWKEKELCIHDTGWLNYILKSDLFSGLFVKLFLTVNPGIFILILSSISTIVTGLIAFLLFFIFVVMNYRHLKIYFSLKNYEEFEKVFMQFVTYVKTQIEKGYVVEDSKGRFFYTKKWYQSDEYKSLDGKRLSVSSTGSVSFTSYQSSSGSSSSSSRSSSSSGGGRSGGGGSSSSW
jgi:uncharacterized protein